MQANYNGYPLFEVSEDDFMYIVECKQISCRLLSKNIKDETLREYYVNTRKPQFAVSFDNVVVYWGK